MKAISFILQELETSGYLRASLAKNGNIEIMELLKHGQSYCEHLKAQWQQTIDKNMPTFNVDSTKSETVTRYAFIFTPEFRKNIQILNKICPGIIKSTNYVAAPNNSTKDAFKIINNARGCTQLISDYFVHPSIGKEKFYSVQRSRKIWWMLYSTNSSRYHLEALEEDLGQEGKLSEACQSVNIMSRFSFGSAAVEQLSLVPLREIAFSETADYQLKDERYEGFVRPTVIRAAVNLEIAACALLFDGFEDRGNNSLLIDRNLAPVQCAVACLYDANISADLRDLCRHVTYVVREIGLRISDEIYTDSHEKLDVELSQADNIGVPYTIIIDQESLRTGFLKLRNRDTTLAETIHISDIKPYFNSIFMPYETM